MKVLHNIGLFGIIMGFLVVMGAAGTSDIDPTVPLWELVLYSLAGIIMMALGAFLVHDTME